MLQRIQTVYLLLGAGCLGIFLGMGRAWGALFDVTVGLAGQPLRLAVSVLAGVVAAVVLAATFLYKSRDLQAKVIGAAMVGDLLLALAMMAAIGAAALAPDVPVDGGLAVEASVALLPVVAYLFLHLARRAVRRDVELIRSMDRLR